MQLINLTMIKKGKFTHLGIMHIHSGSVLSPRKKALLRLFKEKRIKEINIEEASNTKDAFSKKLVKEYNQLSKGKISLKDAEIYRLLSEIHKQLKKELKIYGKNSLERMKIENSIEEIEYLLDVLKFIHNIQIPISLEPSIPLNKKLYKDFYDIIRARDQETIKYLKNRKYPTAILRGKNHDAGLIYFARKYDVPLEINYLEKPIRGRKGTPLMTTYLEIAQKQKVINPRYNMSQMKEDILEKVKMIEILSTMLPKKYSILRNNPMTAMWISTILVNHPKSKAVLSQDKKTQREFWSFANKIIEEFIKK